MLALILAILTFLHLGNRAHASMPSTQVLAIKTMSMKDRYPVESVNNVFKDNILLTIAYMKQGNTKSIINAKSTDKPFKYSLTLHKNEVFAFHDTILPQYSGKVVATTHAHFNSQEGFESDGYLFGDGTCHLASLIDYAAKAAGLNVEAPTSHDFAKIPEVPKQFGVAIYTTPNEPTTSALQNLYVTNPFSQDVTMVFDYKNSVLKLSILKQS